MVGIELIGDELMAVVAMCPDESMLPLVLRDLTRRENSRFVEVAEYQVPSTDAGMQIVSLGPRSAFLELVPENGQASLIGSQATFLGGRFAYGPDFTRDDVEALTEGQLLTESTTTHDTIVADDPAQLLAERVRLCAPSTPTPTPTH